MKKNITKILVAVLVLLLVLHCGCNGTAISSSNTLSEVNNETTNSEEVGQGEAYLIGKTLRPSDGSVIDNKPDYMITDFIPCKPFYSYTVTENHSHTTSGASTTRCIVYNSNKEMVQTAYEEARTEAGAYTHTFTTVPGAAYIRVQLAVDDTDLTITENGATDDSLIYKNKSLIQGMCASEDFLFVSYSKSMGDDKNDYQIRKIDRATGEILLTSIEYFNHANGLTYNKNTNEVIVCAFDGNTGSTETTCDEDFSLYVVDADTLTLKRTVNLKASVLSVCAESCGIGGVTYSAENDEYYAFTRYPERHIITFNGDFTLKDSTYLYHYDDKGGTAGDICFDGTYFYIVTWRSDIDQLANDVAIYTKDGVLVDTYNVTGIAHIESIDKVGDVFYMAFIADLGKPSVRAEVYRVDSFTGDITLP